MFERRYRIGRIKLYLIVGYIVHWAFEASLHVCSQEITAEGIVWKVRGIARVDWSKEPVVLDDGLMGTKVNG